MASPKEGFLTDEQREVLKIAAQNAEVLSSSPRSPTTLLFPEHHSKGGAGGKASSCMRHMRRTHSGKLVRVKKAGLFRIKKRAISCLWYLRDFEKSNWQQIKSGYGRDY